MNLQIVEAVYTVVTGEPGHLDQYPYIDSWAIPFSGDLPNPEIEPWSPAL